MVQLTNMVGSSRIVASRSSNSLIRSSIPRSATVIRRRSLATVTSHPSHPSTPPNPPSPSSTSTTSTTTSDSTTTTHSPTHKHKVLIVGGGAAGQSVSHQLLRSNLFSSSEIAIIDPSTTHDYQPGWTLVGAGLNSREDFRREMKDLIGQEIKWYRQSVEAFQPDDNLLTTKEGDTFAYDQLVVCPGLEINFDGIKGLKEALKDAERTRVSSIYSYVSHLDKVGLMDS